MLSNFNICFVRSVACFLKPCTISRSNVYAFRFKCSAAVSGDADNFFNRIALCELPGNRVFATAVTDDDYFHAYILVEMSVIFNQVHKKSRTSKEVRPVASRTICWQKQSAEITEQI